MNRKIDIYVKQELPITPKKTKSFWQYKCSTKQAKTCREAVAKFCFATGRKPEQIKANFSKSL